MLVTDEMVEKALDDAPAFEIHPRHDQFRVVVKPAMPGKLQPFKGEGAAQYNPIRLHIRFHDFTTEKVARAFIRSEYMRAAIEAVAPAIRAAALEEAAKECDFMAVETTKLADRLDDKDSRLYALLMAQAQAAKNRAAAIRALKEPT